MTEQVRTYKCSTMYVYGTYNKYHTNPTYDSNAVQELDLSGSAARSRMVWSMVIREQSISKRLIIIKHVNFARRDGYNELFLTYLDERI